MVAPSRLRNDVRAAPDSIVAPLRSAVILETDLDRLSSLFADLLADHGVPGHFCVRRNGQGMTPLFGDRPELMTAPQAAGVEVDNAPGAAATMLLAPEANQLHGAARALVRGYAVLVASRGALLAMKQATVATTCPLSLEQRTILARMLCGVAEIDIAAELDMPVALVTALVADAGKLLGTRNQTETIAASARRGWLVMMVNPFYTLFDGELA